MKFVRSMRYDMGNCFLGRLSIPLNMFFQTKQLDRQYRCLQILKRARVVGMTTTGAAIHQELLNKLEAPIMFVEEAAEVLESNLLATLTPHVKHLVLIGDHKQLKPQVRFTYLHTSSVIYCLYMYTPLYCSR